MYDDSFESHVKDCLETIRQDVETIENNQAKLKEDLKSFKHKRDNTTESLNLKVDPLNGTTMAVPSGIHTQLRLWDFC